MGIKFNPLTGAFANVDSFDINELTANASPVGSTDYVAIYNASTGSHQKTLLDNLPGGGGGVTVHDSLTGLADDDHTQYALLAGRGAAQTLTGGVTSGGNLQFISTSHATKGSIIFGSNNVSAYDETNDRLGLGTTSPAFQLTLSETLHFTGTTIGSLSLTNTANLAFNPISRTLQLSNNGNSFKDFLLSEGSGSVSQVSYFTATDQIGPCLLYTNNNGRQFGIGNLSLDPVMLRIAGLTDNTLTGLITITTTSTNVTGSGTSFLTECTIGTIIRLGGFVKRIESIISDTTLTVDSSPPINRISESASTLYDLFKVVQEFSYQTNPAMVIKDIGNVGLGLDEATHQLTMNKQLRMLGSTMPAVSPTASGVIYFDNSTNTFRVSENAGAYQDLVGGGGGVTVHDSLTGLADDDHTQYALLAGRTTGQTLTGGANASASLNLISTSNATKGNINIEQSQALRLVPWGDSTGSTTQLQFLELSTNGSNYVSFKSPDAISSNVTWTLPDADGSSGEVLKTNGTGTLSWGAGAAAPPAISWNEVEAATGTSSTTYTEMVALSITAASAEYKISWSMEVNTTFKTAAVQTRVQYNNTDTYHEVDWIPDPNSSGYGQVSGFKIVSLTAGGASFDIDWASRTSGKTVNIRRARISAMKLG